MNGNLNKILSVAGLFCGSLLFSSIYADGESSDASSKSSMSLKEITPPAGFAAEQGLGFSIYADFIYWEARQPNLAFAATGSFTVNPDADNVLPQGEVYFPKFQYKPGFKVGLSIDIGHDNWDLDANYTWLNGSGEKNSVAQDAGVHTLIPLITIAPTVDDDLTYADGNWFFHHNLINVTLGRDYFISQKITLRPHFGLSGAWNHQKNDVHYSFESAYSDLTTQVNNYLKQSYWGVGFNTGISTAWLFDENWSIYGNFAIMNLWSKYDYENKQVAYEYDEYGAIDPDTENTHAYSQSVQYGFQNVIDLEMGLRWATTFDDDTMGAALQLGWEQQVWINHVSYATTGASNLSLQGLTARLKLNF